MNYENTEGCRIIQAGFQEQTLQVVRTITRETIQEIYPHYYPKGAVDFFLSHHNEAGIRQDLEAGSVYLLLNEKQLALGTVTLKNHEIYRESAYHIIPTENGDFLCYDVMQKTKNTDK